MPTYFFHLRDADQLLLDAEGRMLDDIDAIARAALMEARALISADALSGRIDIGQRIEVQNDAGRMVHQLPFTDAVEVIQPRPGTPPC